MSYTYYNILMYSVVTNSNGNEERSLPSKERVYVFIQGELKFRKFVSLSKGVNKLIEEYCNHI